MRESKRVSKLWGLVPIMALLGMLAFVQNLGDNNNSKLHDNATNLTAKQVEPLVSDFLKKQKLLTDDGTVLVPGTDGSKFVTEQTVSDLVNDLLHNGQANYIQQYIDQNGDLQGPRGPVGAKGDKGDTGDQGIPGTAVAKGDKGDPGAAGPAGPQGSQGAQGVQGNPGAAGADGLITAVDTDLFTVTGGTLSLKPCSTDEVLVYGVASWECDTVSGGGVDDNTTNTSATLTYSSKTLKLDILDSNGDTVTSNTVDLADDFADKTLTETALSDLTDSLSDLATANDLGDLATRVTGTEGDIDALESAVAGKQASLPACSNNQVIKYNTGTSAWVCGDDDNTTYNLSSYVTDGELTTALQDYYTSSEVDGLIDGLDLGTVLPTCGNGQVVKYNTTGSNWQCGDDNNTTYDLSGYATNDGLNTALGDYTKSSDLDATYATDNQLSAALDDYVAVANLADCDSGEYLTYDGSDFSCVADTDTDTNTTYTASTGLSLTGTAFSVNSTDCSNSTTSKLLFNTSSGFSCATDANTTYDLSGYATTDDLSGYVPTAHFVECGDGYTIKYDVDNDWWVCDVDQDTTYDLSGYVTNGDLTTALEDYYNATGTDGAISAQLSDLSGNSNIDDILAGYVTSGSLTDQLSGLSGDISTLQGELDTLINTTLVNQGTYSTSTEYATGENWDGRPVYRRAFSGTFPAIDANALDTESLATDTDIAFITDFGGSYYHGSDAWRGIGTGYTNTDTPGSYMGSGVNYNASSGAVDFWSMDETSRSSGDPYYVWIEYVKVP